MTGWSLAIDFGTSFTTAAMTHPGDETGEPVLLEVDHSRYLPSVVFRNEAGELLTGRAATTQAAVFPERAERAPKRALAAGHHVVLGGVPVPITTIVAAVLRRMYAEAVRYHGGEPPVQVALTRPARWGDAPLGQLRAAAATAGFADPVLVPEPVAAAWRYARPDQGGLIAVFDLGGGSLDTAVLRARGQRYEVIGGPGGDAGLSGEDFDTLLLARVSALARERGTAEWARLFENTSAIARRERSDLRSAVTAAKETLSEHLTCDLAVPGFAEEFRLTRAELEELISAAADRAVAALHQNLTAARVTPGQLTALCLVGGSSRIPLIATRLAAGLGVLPQLRDDPKAAIALGAIAAVTAGQGAPPTRRPVSLPTVAMFRGGPDHRGVYPPGAPSPGSASQSLVPWRYQIIPDPGENPFFSSPSVAAGAVYVGSSAVRGCLYALDAATGQLQWKYQTGNGIGGSPLAADDLIYFGSADCHVYAVNAATGSLRWSYRADGPIGLSSPAAVGRSVYVGCRDGNLYALDSLSGLLRWKYQSNQMIESSPAVADGVVYIGSVDHRFFAIDEETGIPRWSFRTDGHVLSSPTVLDGIVYIGSCDRYLYALDAATGALVWKYKTGGWVASSPAVADGFIYVGSNDDHLYALNAATGTLRWRYQTDNYVLSSPALAGRAVYFGSGKSLFSIDAATGAQRWRYETGDVIFSSPAVTAGAVYIGSADGYLHAVNAELGFGPP